MGTRDGELFKDKVEVSLDGRQIFCLFCGGAVIAALVFVLGVMVGRRVEARANPEQAAAGSPVSDPLAALDQFAAHGDADADRDADSATATDAQLPSALREGQAAPPTPVDLSLAQPPAPKPKPEPAAIEPKKEDSKPMLAKVEPPAKPELLAKVEPPAKPEPPAKVEPPAKPEPPKAEAKGRYTLQLSSFQSRAEADAFAAELKKAGYPLTITEANVEGKGTWFRVRLGSYGSHEEALAAKADFESKQKIIAYVTRVK